MARRDGGVCRVRVEGGAPGRRGGSGQRRGDARGDSRVRVVRARGVRPAGRGGEAADADAAAHRGAGEGRAEEFLEDVGHESARDVGRGDGLGRGGGRGEPARVGGGGGGRVERGPEGHAGFGLGRGCRRARAEARHLRGVGMRAHPAPLQVIVHILHHHGGRAGRDGRVADRAQRTRSGRRHHRAIAACGVRVARANTDTRRALARYDLCRPLERERRTVRFVNFRYHFVRGSMTQLIRNIREDPSLRAAFSPRAFPPRRVSRDDGHTTRASDTIHHTTLASDTT